MSSKIDQDRLELLITRHLDGVLSDEEQLELDREVLRNPESRLIFEESCRADDLASSFLIDSLDGDSVTFDPQALTSGPRISKHRSRVAWWLMPCAAAACLAFVVFFCGPNVQAPSSSVDMNLVEAPVAMPQAKEPSEVFGQESAQMASHGPRKIKRHTDREVMGVMGTDGNVYFIEVDRVRTFKGLRPESSSGQSAGDM